jgi:two-component system response regulator NreC
MAMDGKIRIFLADDHAIIRDGLRAILSDHREFEVVGEAADGIEAIRGCGQSKPDLLLLDISMPKMNGIEAISDIKKQDPDIKILILSLHRSGEQVRLAIKAGADGYALKDAKQKELVEAIHAVMNGEFYLCKEVGRYQPHGSATIASKDSDSNSGLPSLTKREREILKLVAEGFTSKEIAEYLFISAKTVDNHRTNLMRKLNLHSAQALTSFAIRAGLTQ